MSRLLMFMIVVFWFQNASAASWLCVPEATAGFSSSNGKWQAGPYSSKTPLIIRKARLPEEHGWVFMDTPTFVAHRIGDDSGIVAYFHDEPSERVKQLESSYGSHRVFLNTEKGSYVVVNTWAYLDHPEWSNYFPFMEVGRCTSVD